MIKAIIAVILLTLNISQAWAAPNIQVWYNYSGASPDIAFGLPGRTQTWVNVIGNVQSDVGIDSLTYNINGGTEQTLVLGPNKRRLVALGDFNVEVDPTDPKDPFFAGVNFVNLKATDNNGVVATKTVAVDYAPGYVWPYPHTVDWQSSTIEDVESIAHIVDGKWQITANGIRTIQTGYDRTIAIGDRTWSTDDVSVTVPFILHTDFKGIGFGMGWQGHSGWVKPRKGWAGTYAWVRGPLSNPELNIMIYDPVEWEVVLASKPVSIALNTPYLLKSYAQPVDSTTSYFCIKLWPQSGSEPDAWDLCSDVPYRDGSVLLAVNKGDATFGDVSMGPLSTTPPPVDTTAPVISAVQASSITANSATITWTTDEASNSLVNYGTTTSYGSNVSGASLVTSHSINLSGLSENTLYHYRVNSTDGSNNTATSEDFTFTTSSAPPTDTTAPVISAVQASSVTANSATITWTTDETSNSLVNYGTTTSYGSNGSDASLVTSHSINLSGLSENTLYHYRVNSTDGSNNTATSEDFTFTTASSGTGSIVLYRVNAGGPALTSTPNWSVDTAANPSPYVNAAETGNKVYSTSNSIDLTDPSLTGIAPPMALFQKERYDPSGGVEMQWTFPVTAGQNYVVRLYFAETFSNTQSVGARKFDVLIEGALMLDDYDIFADVGANKGVMKSFTVTPDASLNIDFIHVKQNPAIKGIEILQLDGG